MSNIRVSIKKTQPVKEGEKAHLKNEQLKKMDTNKNSLKNKLNSIKNAILEIHKSDPTENKNKLINKIINNIEDLKNEISKNFVSHGEMGIASIQSKVKNLNELLDEIVTPKKKKSNDDLLEKINNFFGKLEKTFSDLIKSSFAAEIINDKEESNFKSAIINKFRDAISNENKEALNKLLEKYPEYVNAEDGGHPVAYYAALKGNKQIFNMFNSAKEAKFDLTKDMTLLKKLSTKSPNHVAILKTILTSSRVDLNSEIDRPNATTRGTTLLNKVITHEGKKSADLTLIEMLVKCGAKFYEKISGDTYGFVPIEHAIMNKRLDIVKIMLNSMNLPEAAAMINGYKDGENNMGDTLLYYAYSCEGPNAKKDEKMISLLLEYGADPFLIRKTAFGNRISNQLYLSEKSRANILEWSSSEYTKNFTVQKKIALDKIIENEKRIVKILEAKMTEITPDWKEKSEKQKRRSKI